MKLIVNNDNNIICKSNRSNEDILAIIKKDIFTIWDRNPSKWITTRFNNELRELEIHEGFSIYLKDNEIEIFGDNGLIELEIVDINNIENL